MERPELHDLDFRITKSAASAIHFEGLMSSHHRLWNTDAACIKAA